MGYDAAHQRTILYGGYTVFPYPANLTREMDATGQWIELPISTPPGQHLSCSMTYDSDRQRLVLYGGYPISGPQTLSDKVWEFDGGGGGAWSLSGTGPAARFNAPMAFDPVRHRLIIGCGGEVNNGSLYPGTWERDPATLTWTNRADDGPGARVEALMVYDAARSSLLQFGGQWYYNHSLNDLWRFDAAGTQGVLITQQPMPLQQELVIGQSASITVAATGATSYQWLHNGVPIVDGGPVLGAHTPTLSISPVVASDTGGYSVLVSGGCGSAHPSTSLHVFDPNACYANCDRSTILPYLNINDFQCFLNKFAAGDSYANCDSSTAAPILNANDFQCFLSNYGAGCF
jgi:hypothetical protein